MKTYGTLREYIEKNNVKLNKLTVRTSDTYYLGAKATSWDIFEPFLDSLMWLPPEQTIYGEHRCFVQD